LIGFAQKVVSLSLVRLSAGQSASLGGLGMNVHEPLIAAHGGRLTPDPPTATPPEQTRATTLKKEKIGVSSYSLEI
jgi:hypothetical protein